MTILQMALAVRQREQRGRAGAFIARFREWRRRARERQELMTMSDMSLRDIGITRCDAMNEASKPFWRA
jgi:uncharacterized protein YjiS (DUF1127 family)